MGLGMILLPAATLFLQKLVYMVKLDQYVGMRDLLTDHLSVLGTNRQMASE